MIATLKEDEGQGALEAIHAKGGEAVVVQTDVSSETSVKAMIAKTLQTYGQINTLVNNAGITLFKHLFDATLEDWEKVIGVDLKGVFLCSKHEKCNILAARLSTFHLITRKPLYPTPIFTLPPKRVSTA